MRESRGQIQCIAGSDDHRFRSVSFVSFRGGVPPPVVIVAEYAKVDASDGRNEAPIKLVLIPPIKLSTMKKPTTKTIFSEKIQCQTCQATENCEEDEDNPGTYYCLTCWEEYETQLECNPTNSGKTYENQFSDTCKFPLNDAALWIVHDNPHMGKELAPSQSEKMKCLLETKEPGSKKSRPHSSWQHRIQRKRKI